MSRGMSGAGSLPGVPGDEGRGAGDEGKAIYLDHNATTPLDPRVLEEMTRVWRDCGANPASQHAAGRKARRLVEEAREGILALLGARTSGMAADRLIFTSGGTEANHLALHGLRGPQGGPLDLAISAIEHPSIQGTAKQLQAAGRNVRVLPMLMPNRIPDLNGLFTADSRPCLVSVMLASNETGFIMPVGQISRIAADHQSLVHTDAVQAVGKIPVDFRDLQVAAMTVAPHKFHGPIGIGGLLLRHDVELQPQLLGGFQQSALRAGTESAALTVGFHRALQFCYEEFFARNHRMQNMRDQFVDILCEYLPTCVVISGRGPGLPQTACISFPPLDRQALAMALDLAGVACSTGSACASGSSEPSPTLLAMQLPEAVISSALRFSLGAFTTTAEVVLAAERIVKTVKQLQHAI